MSSAFGLYGARTLAAGARVDAGDVFELSAPVFEAGVVLFRRSLWLPMPAGLAQARTLALGGGHLALRFAPLRLTVGTGSTGWFESSKRGAASVRLKMRLPAPVLRFRRPPTASQHEIALKRADGDAVSEQAAATGRTDVDLDAPWVGADVVVELGAVVGTPRAAQTKRPKAAAAARPARAAAPTGAAVGIAEADFDHELAHTAASLSVISQVVVGGAPTSPRLKLWAEPDSGAPTLLWQAVLAGPRGAVELPAEPVAAAWAPALERARALLANSATAPVRLRLDLESDLPCTVTVLAADLALDADFELLAEPARFEFDGTRPATGTLPLTLPGGGAAQSLSIAGRVVADAGADAGAGGEAASGRQGALAGPETTLQQPLVLPEAMRLAGLAIAWQPLSDALRGQWRLLADGGHGPAPTVLASAPLSLPTPAGGWLALRFSGIDVQPQRLWFELALAEGSGLWLFADEPDPAGAGRAGGLALDRALWVQALAGGAAIAGATRSIGLALGATVLAPSLNAGPLKLDVPPPALASLATAPLSITAGVAGSVTIESARVRMRMP